MWAWHGDYLNLGAGAEIGIYFRPTDENLNSNVLDHYFAHPEFTVPMQLYLYNYEGENSIENIFAWEPSNSQWWITGFRPEIYSVTHDQLLQIASVDFSENPQMLENLGNQNPEEIEAQKIIIDEKENMLWLTW